MVDMLCHSVRNVWHILETENWIFEAREGFINQAGMWSAIMNRGVGVILELAVGDLCFSEVLPSLEFASAQRLMAYTCTYMCIYAHLYIPRQVISHTIHIYECLYNTEAVSVTSCNDTGGSCIAHPLLPLRLPKLQLFMKVLAAFMSTYFFSMPRLCLEKGARDFSCDIVITL